MKAKTWTVGNRVVVLMPSGAVRIATAGVADACFLATDDEYTLATGLAGVIGLRDALNDVIDEIKRVRGIT